MPASNRRSCQTLGVAMDSPSGAKSPLDINYRLELGEFTEVAAGIEVNNQKLIEEQFAEDRQIIKSYRSTWSLQA
jgi:hypothetical protein